ncbi:MAG: triphosphoribosyl-dephospho-CoA synthase CitG [Firmicutes bacterium]|nr:triphosphoribosyl-dephospho-CoA synthase CitG [Bacillota bacterium]
MISNEDFCESLSEYAVKALLYEVSATPKPGLVDRCNAGAHKDMDFFTFMSSSAVLAHYFYKCAQKGVAFEGQDSSMLLHQLRSIGIKAERKMYQATNGVNTHKGLIFSLGIICAAAANCFSRHRQVQIPIEEICRQVAQMAKGIAERELKKTGEEKNPTYGEKLYKKYGIKGIRGEVENGFLTVRKRALPVFLDLIKFSKRGMNDILVQVLLHLMSVSEDTNIIGRHDLNTLSYVKESAAYALSRGGMFTEEGRACLRGMDAVFIRKNISPGGSADLLAVTIMFYFLSEKDHRPHSF